MPSATQSRGIVAQQVRATARWRRILELSDSGATKEDAAKAVGMTDKGLGSLLYRNTKSTKWPIKGSANNA